MGGFTGSLLVLCIMCVVWIVVGGGIRIVRCSLVLVILFWFWFAFGCGFGFSAWLLCVDWLGGFVGVVLIVLVDFILPQFSAGDSFMWC